MATRMVRWDPFREIASLQRELSRALGGVGDGDAGTRQAWIPPVDVWETENDVVYAFDLPGVPEDKISVELEENALTVSGERERTQEVSEDSFYRFERRLGAFSRTIGLPQGVTDNDISADYKDGVLEVRVAKPETPKPRRIQVGRSDEGATVEGTANKA
jgi:HSP20 family protein